MPAQPHAGALLAKPPRDADSLVKIKREDKGRRQSVVALITIVGAANAIQQRIIRGIHNVGRN
jgi:hypothetical protein